MQILGEYIVSVTGSAILCSILLSAIPPGSCRDMLRMLCGCVMILTVLSPISRDVLPDMLGLVEQIKEDAMENAAYGEGEANKVLHSEVKEKTEHYIRSRGLEIGADVQVQVQLCEDPLPIPVSVELSGTASFLQQKQIAEIISEDLGIAEENQKWIGTE